MWSETQVDTALGVGRQLATAASSSASAAAAAAAAAVTLAESRRAPVLGAGLVWHGPGYGMVS